MKIPNEMIDMEFLYFRGLYGDLLVTWARLGLDLLTFWRCICLDLDSICKITINETNLYQHEQREWEVPNKM